MASRKIRDIVVTVGEYTDRNTGETKKRYENVGALMKNDDDEGSLFIMLRRTFNPAGVPKQDDRESILLSCYVPKDQREESSQDQRRDDRQTSQSRSSNYDRDDSRTHGGASRQRELDDDIPF